MLRCLKAINPTRCCFTATDLEDSLAEIESILNELSNSPKGDSDPIRLHLHKESAKTQLEKAYILSWRCLSNSNKLNPDRQLIFLVADIVSRYGQLCLHENYFSSQLLLSVSMNLLFYSMGILPLPTDLSPFYSLKDLVVQAKEKKHLFDFMHDMLLTTPQEKILSAIVSDNLLRPSAPKRLLTLAKTAKLLALTYKYVDDHNASLDLLKQLFHFSESLLLLIDDAQSREELGDLYFSAWPLFSGPDPASTQAFTLYEKTIAHYNTQEMRARAANKQFMVELASGNMQSAQKWIQEALLLANDTPPSEFNPYILSSIHNNYASFFLEEHNFDIEKCFTYLKKACDFACQSRQAGEDRLYFAAYDERMAEIQYLLGDFKTAKTYIETALTTLEKYPESNLSLLTKTEALQSIINKTLQLINQAHEPGIST